MGFDQALELVREGRGPEAERLLGELAERARQEHGAESAQHAAALYDMAKIRIAVGDLARAVEPLRAAANIRVAGEEGERERLTYNMNLGDVLDRLDRLDEAELVLREGLAGREQLYGLGHPGYAFGLEPLASVLFRQGKNEEAFEAANRAVRLLWDHGNPKVAVALATRAPIAIASGGKAFDETGALPEELFDQLVHEVLARADRDDPTLQLVVLDELQDAISSRRGSSSPMLPLVLAAMTNGAREAGDGEARVAAFRVLVAWLDGHDDAEQALDAMLGLALALDDGDDAQGARQAYEDSLARAERLASPDAVARVLRNYALFCSHRDEPAEASQLFERALGAADGTEGARTSIAFGIFRQHHGALEQAAELLRAGLAGLDPAEPDTLYARSHLQAIEQGGSCGCGRMDESLGEALTEMVRPDLPPGLLHRLRVTIGDGGPPQIAVELARDPTEAELALLESVVNQAVAQLQARIRGRGTSKP